MRLRVIVRFWVPLLLATTGLVGSSTAANAAPGPAHSWAAARTHSVTALNHWRYDVLVRHTQQNWYRFVISSPSYVSVVLGSLPANYSIRLYNKSGAVLGMSYAPGTHFEDIDKNLKAGTYFVRVASTKGANSKVRYALGIRAVAASRTVGVLSAHVGTVGDVVGDFVNPSSQWITVKLADVYYYGAGGKLLRKYDHLETFNGLWIVIAPGHRAPYSLLPPNVPQSIERATKQIKVVPYVSVDNVRKGVASLKIGHLQRTAHKANGVTWVDFKGTIQNSTSRAVPLGQAVIVAWNAQGVPVGVAWSDSTRLPVHATRSFSTRYDNLAAHLTFTAKGYEITSAK